MHYGVGVCHALQGQTEEAISHFERAVEIFPLLTAAHLNLGMSYLQNLEMEKAVRAFETVIELEGTRSEYGAMAKERLDSLDGILRKAHGIGLQDYLKNQRVFLRAFDALKKKEFDTAIDLFSQVLRVDKNHVQSYGNLGLAYAGIGDSKRAAECFDKALALDPDYEPAAHNRRVLETTSDCSKLFEENAIGEVEYYRDREMGGKALRSNTPLK